MITEVVDGVPIRLREPHDLAFLGRWGRVFAVLDEQDSGNLCFGVSGPDGRVFVKYAGARPTEYDGRPGDAVSRLRLAENAYRALAHPTLARLREAVGCGAGGYALVFDWIDAVPLGRQYERRHEIEALSREQREAVVQQLFDFHAEVARRGWVAVDLYDASLMVEPGTGRLTVCDIDFYERAPVTNAMGRMWGSARFMSPEEFTLGAAIDEVTNVFTLGALAHTLLGDDATRSADAWQGTERQLAVVTRATRPDRAGRWLSIAQLASAWGDPDCRTRSLG